MQSSRPLPGNPWPRGMVLTVEEDSRVLAELLWIREAWDLHPVGNDLPPSLSGQITQLPASAGSPDRVATWRAAWPGIWDASIRHAGLIRDSRMVDQLHRTPSGSREREQLFRKLFGPSWRDEFGDDALPEQYAAWEESRFEAQSQRRQRTPDEGPERLSLSALIRAWQSGLSNIVTIPCQGSYTRIIGPHSLLVTEETRNNAQTYSAALAQFH